MGRYDRSEATEEEKNRKACASYKLLLQYVKEGY